MRVEHLGRTTKLPDGWVDASSFYHAAVLGNVAKEHCQATVFGVGVLQVAYATFGAVGVEGLPLRVLATHDGRELMAWGTVINAVGLGVDGLGRDVIFLHSLGQRETINTAGIAMQQLSLV